MSEDELKLEVQFLKQQRAALLVQIAMQAARIETLLEMVKLLRGESGANGKWPQLETKSGTH